MQYDMTPWFTHTFQKIITWHGVNVFQKYIHPYHASVSVNPIMHKECKCFITYKVLHGM
jgi:hypothetical protein